MTTFLVLKLTMYCTAIHRALGVASGKGAFASILSLAMPSQNLAMNMAHVASDLRENKNKDILGREQQSTSLTSELQNLMTELQEHRSHSYYAEHVELVRYVLEEAKELDSHVKFRDKSSQQSDLLSNQIKEALQSMPRAMELASRGMQTVEKQGFLNEFQMSSKLRKVVPYVHFDNWKETCNGIKPNECDSACGYLEIFKNDAYQDCVNSCKECTKPKDIHAKLAEERGPMSVWLEEDPRYRLCGKYSFQAGVNVGWGIQAPNSSGSPSYSQNPAFGTALTCVADHGSVLGIFDAVICPVCLFVEGLWRYPWLADKSGNSKDSAEPAKSVLLQLSSETALKKKVLKSAVGIYHELRSSGFLDELNLKTPITLGFGWGNLWANGTEFAAAGRHKGEPDIALAVAIGADWLAQPGYYKEFKSFWPFRGAGIQSYDPESPEAISGFTLEWAVHKSDKTKLSPHPTLIYSLAAGLPWRNPPLSYSADFKWPRYDKNFTQSYKNWWPEVGLGFGAGFELIAPTGSLCEPLNCKWCLINGECKDPEELSGMSNLFDLATAVQPGTCSALGGTWCKPCAAANWNAPELEGCGYDRSWYNKGSWRSGWSYMSSR
jgi:hypothetical protein